jgi:ferric-dicitrate binding protein FerR (iron transport regulator)
MNEQRARYLFDRYLHKTYSEEEKQAFLQLLDEPGGAAMLEALNAEIASLPATGIVLDAEPTEAIRTALLAVTKQPLPGPQAIATRRFMRSPLLRYAAAILLLLGVAGVTTWYIRHEAPKPDSLSQTERFKNEVAPGHSGGVLTLSNGRQIVLDSTGNGVLAKDGNVQLVKKDGQVSYEGATGQALYNHITTGNGQQWQLALNDGTKVWLNAASSISYPVAFAGADREVEITGEAYFEVGRDAAHPFHVKVGGQLVEVLGTHFNINAYSDEGVIKTTLLEGSVKMQSAVIEPGQQIQVSEGGKIKVVKDADTEQAVAWKNGLFQFDNADIQFVMRQIGRWYNVDIRYPGGIPQRSFGGAMQRSLPLTKVLTLLEDNNVKFTIEGNRINVLP